MVFSYSRRIFILIISNILVFFGIIARLLFLQIQQSKKYKTLSEKNRVHIIMIDAPRGKILDTNYSLLADNILSFELLLNKDSNYDYMSSIYKLTSLLDYSSEQMLELQLKVKKNNSRRNFILLSKLSWKEVAIIEENINNMPGLVVQINNRRHYSMLEPLAHVIGYVGYNNTYNDSSYIGKSGIELEYNQILKGTYGIKEVEVDAYGKYVKDLTHKPYIIGGDVQLHINAELQEEVFNILPNNSTAIVADLNNGGIISLLNKPSFDMNRVYSDTNYWKELLNNKNNPILNKALQGSYLLGSVFKLITFLAALDVGIGDKTTYNCTGEFYIKGMTFRCWKTYGHGVIDMHAAMKVSCNCYVYYIASKIGVNAITKVAKILGLGKLTNIDLPHEVRGFVPSVQWKKKVIGEPWTIGDTINLSMGQGFIHATPIQMLKVISSIATGQDIYFSILKNRSLEFEYLPFHQEHLSILRRGIYASVYEDGGTGARCRMSGSNNLVGKTGTAQLASSIHKNKPKSHSWFVGYGPYSIPRYAVIAFVQNGGWGGRVAAPIAKDIMSLTYDIHSS